MRPHIRVILPLRFSDAIRDYCRDVFEQHLTGSRLSCGFLLDAVDSTVSDYDQCRNAPWILKAVQAAVRDGCDGIFIDVAFDTALTAAKSLSEVPVVGALEAAVSWARTLCRRFSIVAINAEEVAVDYRLAREYGFTDLLASVEPIEIAVHDLQKDRELTLRRMVEAAGRAETEGAQALVLGCTAMSWAALELADLTSVPVLDTNLIGLYMVDAMARLGLTQSRREFMRPSGLVALTDDEYARMGEITFEVHA